MAYLSLGVRLLVNVEALNMVESVGNYTRHRKAAIIYPEENGSYTIRWVPVISGESLAHAYQCWLSKLASDRGLPVCEYCGKCEFTKHADTKLFGSSSWENELVEIVNKLKDLDKKISKAKEEEKQKLIVEIQKNVHNIERQIIRNCIVEDIGGFMLPARPLPVRRTSRFLVSYIVPAYDQVENIALEPQMHTRSSTRVAGGEEVSGQMIYYIEIGSAIYSWSMSIDLNGIGRTSFIRVEDAVDKEERLRRIEAAVDALLLMLESRLFGAKQSRYMPIINYESLVIAVSDKYPFNVSAPANKDYAITTLSRAKAFSKATGSNVKLYGYNIDVKEIETFNTISELLRTVKEEIIG
ncbi:MAG: type I-A CRISPR-associated protein Cas7/Csa2 [Thermoprotei archaeon]|nr:MAG: type I-A CRISPR-associated protein Cas7/Csa2 [Thermoprotei archaeon]